MQQRLDPIRNAFDDLLEQVIGFLPNLIAALLLLAVGWIVSRLLAAATTRVVRRIKLDAGMNRDSWRDAMKRAGISLAPSEIVGRIVFWTVLLIFVVLAVENLGLGLTAVPLRSFIAYLPRVLGAVLILFLGTILAGVLGKAFSVGLARLDFGQHRVLANAVQGLVFLVTFLAAFDHLGFDVSFLSATLTNLLTIFAAAMAVTFVFGGREVARNMLAGYYAREQYRAGNRIKLGEGCGELLGIGTLTAVVKTEEGELVIPNHLLTESAVVKLDAEDE